MFDLKTLSKEFELRFGENPDLFSAPGRVNLIGEHTDYNDGFVLPFAIDKRTYVACRPREDNVINVYSRTIDKCDSFTPGESKREKSWGLYILGMAEILQRQGKLSRGADMVIDSDIPFGAGLSSSAALEVSTGLALATISGEDVDLIDLALAGQKVENEYLRVRSGIMDQFTSATGMASHALLIDCRSLESENIPLKLNGLSLVVCDSKVKHELASSEYNVRREQCEEGVRSLKERFPAVRSLRDISIEELHNNKDLLEQIIYRRCHHVVTENDRTLGSAKALRENDFERLGDLMYRSHQSLKDDYAVSCDELDVLVDTAAQIEGVIGSRMTGGGFGGCTITLLQTDKIEEFRSGITRNFKEKFDREPEVFTVVPSEGAKAHADSP